MNDRPVFSALRGELALAVVLLLASALLLWQAYRISGFASLTSAGAFPMLASAVMLGTAAITLARALRARIATTATPSAAAPPTRAPLMSRTLVVFLGAIVLYLLLIERLGFVVSSYLFLTGSMWLLGSRRIGFNLLVSAVVLGIILLVFRVIFSVVLPKGSWLATWWP
ncbi:MAG: tripartite tricarboxylate transporter TctB family protein [Casimicrobiaceae bacterium]|nr:tripartite tricarboxylate transporter TctB family protein [Casimicrobiaceae bacterium]MCX8099572.1 tripartite tricarboxylate transporter TctB family protein [Casimicrobiaceae bacterium]MDW8313001.1 tripartite tricarboxylate transporter TctB family protein [Burkholderiales bacterium]